MVRKSKRYEKKLVSCLEAYEEAASIIEELKDEMENWRDNTPKSLQNTDKYSEIEDTISSLDAALSYLQQDEIPEFPERFSNGFMLIVDAKPKTRAERLSVAQSYLGHAKDILEISSVLNGEVNKFSEQEQEFIDNCASIIDSIENADQELDNATFPRMFG